MNHGKLSDINFFISSTYIDMREYREAVIKALQSRAGVINAQEFFGARDRKPLDTCLDELRRSQVFILFLGARYGSVDAESGRSFVECEYDHAAAQGIPRFAYLIDENQSVPFKHVSVGEDAARLAAFRRRVQSELTISTFTTPADLAEKVFADLSRELPKSGFVLGKEPEEKEQADAQKVLTSFKLLPSLYHGRYVSFLAKPGKSERASEEECEAFGLDFGATLKRRCEPVEQAVREALPRSWAVFASGEGATTLLDLPSNQDVRLTVRTIHGEFVTRTPVYGLEREASVFDSIAMQHLGKRRVVVDYNEISTLICGLEFVGLES